MPSRTLLRKAYFTLTASDSSSVFLRYINSRPDFRRCSQPARVAAVTGTVAKLRGATVPNGSPVEL